MRRRLEQRQRARLALAARACDASELARLLDMLALGVEWDAEPELVCGGMDLAGFNDAV
ncbi:hypothetical protein AB0B01_11575 [Streptomyces sp. NPDC044571]|uniref:hypothetical protein n=1 Tax=Streptomyces sp. NPDC044571 TaxID=3155371 RepID=UPI0033CD7DC4